jgi:hypothetical protein
MTIQLLITFNRDSMTRNIGHAAKLHAQSNQFLLHVAVQRVTQRQENPIIFMSICKQTI